MLIDICRLSGASVALRPLLQDTSDSFVLEVSGTASAVEAAKVHLAKLVPEEDGVPAREDVLGKGPLEEMEFEFPRYMNDYVLAVRHPGGKGMGKNDGLSDLQEITKVEQLVVMKNPDKETTHLRAEGEPAALSHLAEVLDERLAACEGILRDRLEVPAFAFGMLFGGQPMLAFQLEAASGAKLSVAGKNPPQIYIRGTADQIEQAKELVLDRCQKKSKGKWKPP